MTTSMIIAIAVATVVCWRIAMRFRPRSSSEKAADRQLHQILRHYSGGVWLIDNKGFTVLVNADLARMIGLSAESVSGKHYLDFLRCNDGSLPADSITMTALAGFRNEEFKILNEDRHLIPVLLTGSKLFDHAGRTRGTLLWVSDLSERKRLTEVVEKQKGLLESVTESSSLAITASDLDGRIQYANASAALLFGRTKGELENLTWPQVLGDDAAAFTEKDLDVVEHGGEQVNVVELESQSRKRILRFAISPLKGAHGETVGTIRMGRDITRDAEDKYILETYRQIFNATGDVMIVVDSKCRVVDVNSHFCEVSGNKRKAMLGKSLEKFSLVSFERHVVPNVDRCIQGGEVVRIQVRRENQENGAYVDAKFYPLKDKGVVDRALIVSRDISEFMQRVVNSQF